MNNKINYPKNIEDLYKKIDFIIKNEQTEEKIRLIYKWLEWFKKNQFKIIYKCKTNEYLKIYYSADNKYGLQIWIHNKNIDSIKFNLISNYYSEYDTDKTIIVEE